MVNPSGVKTSIQTNRKQPSPQREDSGNRKPMLSSAMVKELLLAKDAAEPNNTASVNIFKRDLIFFQAIESHNYIWCDDIETANKLKFCTQQLVLD